MVDMTLKDEANTCHARALPIPVIYLEAFNKDLDRLVAIGVLTKVNHGKWAAPSFNIPDKDSPVIFISDFRRINKKIKCTPYPLPHIKDMVNKLSNFTYSTTLYLIMVYYNIFLTDAANKICTITTPLGK